LLAHSIITYFFIIELFTRIAVWIYVHRELDRFLIDILNVIDW
jgi:hypothetical protein